MTALHGVIREEIEESKCRPMTELGGVVALVYGVAGYVASMGALLYLIAFVGNWIVPKSIDSGPAGSVAGTLAWNTALLFVFVLQHTVMARPQFKRVWTRVIPAAAERSTFVLAASGSLALLFWQWRPLPQVIWDIPFPLGRALVAGVCLFGWGIAIWSTFLVSHFDLFGLRQTWLRFCGRSYAPVGFRLVGLYKVVRHPLMVGFLIASWAAPTMTVGRLAFALLITAYIVFGTTVEERDLIAEHGASYQAYRRRVRAFLPLPRRAASRIECASDGVA